MEWRYLPKGYVVHALNRPSDCVAICGTSTWSSAEWMGTGSQVEYERAALRRCCRRCLKALDLASDPREHVGSAA